MTDEDALEVLRRTVRCYYGLPTFCPAGGCLACDHFAGRDKMVPALMAAVRALEARVGKEGDPDG